MQKVKLRIPAKRAIYQMGDHEREDLPHPLRADSWFWQVGDRWIAVFAEFHTDWWEGASVEDMAARPREWRRPIGSIPEDGTLIYGAIRKGELVNIEKGL